MSIELVLNKMDKPRKTGRGTWRSNCPCCGGTNKQKLVVKESEDGRVLVKCFAGCDIFSIVSALGLKMSDLFPKTEGGRPIKHPFTREVAGSLSNELTVAWVLLRDIANGKEINAVDRARAAKASAACSRMLQEFA